MSYLSAKPDVFVAIADPTRRAILRQLAGRSLRVSALAAPFAMSRPAVSKHLRVLREAGLVKERRRGRERHYSLRPRALRPIDRWLANYREFWATGLASLRDHVEREMSRERQGKH